VKISKNVINGLYLVILLLCWVPSFCFEEKNEVDIIYYGHSCFEINYLGKRILIDPFTPEWFDYRLPKGTMDYGFATHNAKDHSHFEGLHVHRKYFASGHTNSFRYREKDGTRRDIMGQVSEDIGDKKFTFWTVPSFHDDVRGAKNGVNGILCFNFGGIKIVHLGDIGHLLEKIQIDGIGKVDILMIPVDSYYIIDLKAARKIVDQLSPTIVLPIHYKTDKSKNNAKKEDLASFIKMFKTVKYHDGSRLTIGKADLEVNPYLLVMEYMQEGIKDFPVLRGPYLGQKPPGMQRQIFAPGIVSTGYNEHGANFTPDGKELYYRMLGPPHGVILTMKETNGFWTPPQVAPFSGKYDGKCSLSPDGKTLLISTSSPPSGEGPALSYWTIWIINRNDSGWGKPQNLSHLRGAHPTMSNNGNIYYYARVGDQGDIFMSEYKGGRYSEAIKVGAPISTKYWENDPYIAPDESYLIFQTDRPGTFGEGDLFISYRLEDGHWSQPQNLGKGVNTKESGEGCPIVSPDGKYLFFSSMVRTLPNYSKVPLSLEEKIKILQQPGHGSEDIFWVSTKIIDKLKPKNLREKE
jgi:L-ascorbate metabolism protein UlaG (beta-lactamase superfamily)